MRVLAWAGGLAAAAVVGAMLFVLFGLNLLKAPLAEAVKDATGRELVIEGDLRPVWSWVHPRFRAEGLRISNPAWATDDQLLSAEVVEASISVLPLLQGRLVIPDAYLRKAVISLEEDSQGRKTWVLASHPGREGSPGWHIARLRAEESELRFRHAGLGIDVRGALPGAVPASNGAAPKR